MQETISVITQFISNVGFPIACVCAMFYFWNKERDAHKEEVQAMTDAIKRNTDAITTLTELIKK